MIEQLKGLGWPLEPELGRRTAAEGIEYPVELAERGESTALVDLLDLQIGVKQQLLCILHPCHLDVADQGETRHLLELMGKIARADVELPAQLIKGEFLLVVGMDVTGDGIDLLGD